MREAAALLYHRGSRGGKIQVCVTKPCMTQRDLSLAHAPGASFPCRRIAADPTSVYEYTAKANLIACITNGTAVLDLGAPGPLAAKPAQEGKALLFKHFADIDVFDLELDTTDPTEIVRTTRLLVPTFAAVSLDGIGAPDCFRIEEALRELSIPVAQEDRLGIAITTGAALLNALEIAEKPIEGARFVIDASGPAGIACADLFVRLGATREHILLMNHEGGVVRSGDEADDPYRAAYAAEGGPRTLEQALAGADVLVGFGLETRFTPELLAGLAPQPVVFALAEPAVEGIHDGIRSARPDAILATASPDHPNQISAALSFPFVLRGTLDARATAINAEMRLAAVQALAALVREDVPEDVSSTYADSELVFGPSYVVPKPLDPRALLRVAPAVARAAVATGVARRRLDLGEYPTELERRLGFGHEVVRSLYTLAAREPGRIVFTEGDEEKVVQACQVIVEEGIAHAVLLGSREVIEGLAARHQLDLSAISIVTPAGHDRIEKYCEELYRLRHRKGMTRAQARRLMADPRYFGAMMVHMGDADGLISGVNLSFPEAIRPALRVLSKREGRRIVAALHIVVLEREVFFLADTMVNIEPTSAELAEIALGAVEIARKMNVQPRVGLLSFSNFGSVDHPLARKVAEAARVIRELDSELEVDGEMQADSAVEPAILKALFPFSRLQSRANVLVFPDLQSGNIAYKLLGRLGGALTIGPILMGLEQPFQALERGCHVADIVRMAAVAVVEGQRAQRGA